MICRIVFRLLVTHSVTNRRKTTTTKTPPDCSGRVNISSRQASAGRSLLSASAVTVEIISVVRDFSLEYSSLAPRYKRVAY